ncbi:Xaa-Pro aminopeptidase [Crenobacter cavernae]|uniref:Xaa-Pro aminopeptidase n=1 Tax=Crenobacter cavernae TaxID=2290923 RepID=A0A345Y791_9NEIS|nr:Xaa-Pro aminopeptidase [Crenobacter cavernae]AXK39793.1 Xaa-Pro aminopeptidase [Crenobacter cavernae]
MQYAARRQQLMQAMGGGLAVLPTAPEASRNADTHYPYRPDSHFWYLSGFTEPEAVLVLDARTGKSVLFCRAKNLDMEIWDGFRHGPDGAKEAFGFDEAYPIEELDTRIVTMLAEADTLYWGVGRRGDWDARVGRWLEAARGSRNLGPAPGRFADLATLIDAQRLYKDEAEIATLRRTGAISAEAHVRAMQATRPGRYEYEIEAEILHTFVRHGARHPAYESIVAGGANACTLHYVGNRDRLADGELLLIDAGSEFMGYAGDITRTFPVNGRFTGAQRAVYEVVLAAQLAGIAQVRPGVAWNAFADAALKVLVEGLVDLKLLTGTVDDNIESGAYRQFYMHGLGHWIGLDVHDVGGRKGANGDWIRFAPGMCTTVEPGLYIRPADNVPAEFHNIGIRIEDDVLVTETGHEVYTAGVPKAVDDIEALMRAAKG